MQKLGIGKMKILCSEILEEEKEMTGAESKLNSQTVTKWQLWKQFVNSEAAVNEEKNMNFTL